MSSLFGFLFIEVDVRRSRKPEEREDALVGPPASASPCFAMVFPLSTISCSGLTASRLHVVPSQ